MILSYLSIVSSTACGRELVSLGEGDSSFPSSSAVEELYISEDKRGSGSGFDEESAKEDPPKRACLFPSRNSFLKMLNIEFGTPLRNLLLRCT